MSDMAHWRYEAPYDGEIVDRVPETVDGEAGICFSLRSEPETRVLMTQWQWDALVEDYGWSFQDIDLADKLLRWESAREEEAKRREDGQKPRSGIAPIEAGPQILIGDEGIVLGKHTSRSKNEDDTMWVCGTPSFIKNRDPEYRRYKRMRDMIDSGKVNWV